jgi:hypothetical protein
MGLFLYVGSWNILFLKDLIIGPIVLLIIFLWAYGFRNKNYKKFTYAKYFIPALTVRIVGAILTALMYQYYYHSGDTMAYWYCVKGAWEHQFLYPNALINILFKPYSSYSEETYYLTGYIIEYNAFFRDPSTLIVIRIALFLSYLCYNSYIGVSFLFSVFAFLGCWRLFLVFRELNPKYEKEVAISTLFVPSVFFWGTGVMKDSICIGALGFLTHAVYMLFIKRKFSLSAIFMIIFSTYTLASIKTYIILSFLPPLSLWVILKYWSLIKNIKLKIIAGPIFLFFGIIMSFFMLIKLNSGTQKYTIDSLMSKSKSTQEWLTLVSEAQDGSGYDLGVSEIGSTGDFITVFGKAVNVTLFRPYFWEVRKPILVPAAFESLFCLLLSVYIIFKVGISKIIKSIIKNPDLLFCLLFSILFAFSVGFSTYNFGTLVRYKIPCLPFYFLFILILYKENVKPKNVKPKNVK